jgi:hypothetical protein
MIGGTMRTIEATDLHILFRITTHAAFIFSEWAG